MPAKDNCTDFLHQDFFTQPVTRNTFIDHHRMSPPINSESRMSRAVRGVLFVDELRVRAPVISTLLVRVRVFSIS